MSEVSGGWQINPKPIGTPQRPHAGFARAASLAQPLTGGGNLPIPDPMTSRSFVVESEATLLRAVAAIKVLGWRSPFTVTLSDDSSGAPTAQQYRAFATVLRHVSEQAVLNGKRFGVDAWREHYKALLVGTYEIPVLGGGSRQIPLSTKTLTRKRFDEFLEQICADAATEYGVIFPERGE